MALPNLDKTVTKDPAPPVTDTVLTPIFAPSDGTVALTTLVLNKSIDNINELIDYISGENASGKIPVGTAITGTKANFNTACSNGNFIFVGDALSISAITGTKAQFDTSLTDGDFIFVGDALSISAITGTKAQFDTACTDGDFIYVGDSLEVFTWTANHDAGTFDLISVTQIIFAGTDIAGAGEIRLGAGGTIQAGTTNPSLFSFPDVSASKVFIFNWGGTIPATGEFIEIELVGTLGRQDMRIESITGGGESSYIFQFPNGGTLGSTVGGMITGIADAEDTGTNAVQEFRVGRNDPLDTVISGRPLFEWFNHTTSIAQVTVAGDWDFKSNNIIAANNVEIDGALDHDGSTVGFYGTTPIALQTGVSVDSSGIHAALVALGLIT